MSRSGFKGPKQLTSKFLFPLATWLLKRAPGKLALTKGASCPQSSLHSWPWDQLSEHNRSTHRCLPHCSDSLITPGSGSHLVGHPLLLESSCCSSSGGSGIPLSKGWLCLVCLTERLQDGGGCPCHVSLDMVTGLVDGGAFQARSMGAGCSAAQASSWRVLNPWESTAGSNKHKQPKKPELTKPFLHHCLGKSLLSQHVF